MEPTASNVNPMSDNQGHGLSFSKLDYITIAALGLGTLFIIYKRFIARPAAPREFHVPSSNQAGQSTTGSSGGAASNDSTFVGRMKHGQKTMAVFYGSQTGTAETFANTLVKDAARYGIKALVVDLEEVDVELLQRFSKEIDQPLAIFCMATYGEGDPTDNAQEFIRTLKETEAGEDGPDLSKLSYTVFALGNKTYEHFNAVGTLVDKRLEELHGKRLYPIGLGDDDANIEEDFVQWKDGLWPALCYVLGRTAVQLDVNMRQYRLRLFENIARERLFAGELARLGSYINQKAPYDTKNAFLASILKCVELHNGGDRSCMHVELDLTGSRLRYESGDHLAVISANSTALVERLGRYLFTSSSPLPSNGTGSAEKLVNDTLTLDTPFALENLEEMASKRHPFPCPTTFRNAFTYYLDISGPPRASLLGDLAEFATDPEEKKALKLLASVEGREKYHKYIHNEFRNVVDVLGDYSSCRPPVDLLCELLPRLQVRYYSISSSPKAYPTSVHITAALVSMSRAPEHDALGVATGWLREKMLALKKDGTSPHANGSIPNGATPQASSTPNGVLQEHSATNRAQSNAPPFFMVPVFVRRSQFKLPYKHLTPIIMIGPGTGLAPFRAFIQERHAVRKEGKPIGETVLYTGCRSRHLDYIYGEELDQYKADGTLTSLYVAFSRDQGQKVYVQHLMQQDENRKQLWRLLDKESAHLYVCGDGGHMARDVLAAIVSIVQSEGGRTEEAAREYVKLLRKKGRYSEDVWS